jgi:Ran GTPase-activating protein (RanGAP) involved in mRNA processing and transport
MKRKKKGIRKKGVRKQQHKKKRKTKSLELITLLQVATTKKGSRAWSKLLGPY